MEQPIISLQSLHSVAENCQSYDPLSLQLVKMVDNITAQYSSSFNQQMIQTCHNIWDAIKNSYRFWENVNLIMNNAESQQTLIQTMVLVHQRVRTNWIHQSQETRNFVKQQMCLFSQQYMNVCQSSGQRYKPQFRKINSIIVEILKYQWNSEWSNFLTEICQAMLGEIRFAENYFDLIKVVFDQIFNKDQLLTSIEINTFKNNLNSNNMSHLLFSVFETFLDSKYSLALVRNCLLAFEVVIPKLDAPKIYLNFDFQKITELLMVPHMEIDVLNCLIALFRMRYDAQIQKIIKSKLIDKKQKILCHILSNMRTDSRQILRQKVVDLAFQFISDLEEQRMMTEIQKNQENIRNIHQNNIYISSKLSQIITTLPIEGSDVKVLMFISQHIKYFEYEPLVEKLINITECPINISFYREQYVYESDFISDKETENPSTDKHQEYMKPISQIMESDRLYIQTINKIVEHNPEHYFSVLRKHLYRQINEKQDLVYFCKVCWHFYINICAFSNRMDTILSVTTVISELQQIYSNKLRPTQNESGYIFCTKILKCCRTSIILILSHDKVVQNQYFRPIFMSIIVKSLSQSETIVKLVIQILKSKYSALTKNEILQIRNQYVEKSRNRQDRMKIDGLFLEFICQEFNNEAKLSQDVHAIIQQIMGPYILDLKRLKKTVQPSKNIQNRFKIQIIQSGYKLLYLYAILFKYDGFIDSISESIIEDLNFLLIMEQTCLDIQAVQKTKQYKTIALQMHNMIIVKLFEKIFEDKFGKAGNKLFNVIVNSINRQLLALSEQNIHEIQDEEISILQLVANFIAAMHANKGNQNEQTKIIANIAAYMNRLCFDTLHISHLKYLAAICSSKFFDMLDQNIVSKILYQIFDYAQNDQQKHINLAYQVLSSLLTKSMETIKSQNLQNNGIENFLINLTCNIFKIMICPSFNRHFLKMYCQLFKLALDLIESCKWKFHQTQKLSNIDETCIQLCSIIKKEYCHLRPEFLEEIIENRFRAQVCSNSMDFTQNMCDFLVELRRGFLALP